MKLSIHIDFDSERPSPISITKDASSALHTAAWKNEILQDVDVLMAAVVELITIAHNNKVIHRTELIKSCVQILSDAPYDPGYIPDIRQ